MEGIVHGNIQPLAVENLEDGRDLAVNYRFQKRVQRSSGSHLKINNDKVLFPDWTGKKTGVMHKV